MAQAKETSPADFIAISICGWSRGENKSIVVSCAKKAIGKMKTPIKVWELEGCDVVDVSQDTLAPTPQGGGTVKLIETL